MKALRSGHRSRARTLHVRAVWTQSRAAISKNEKPAVSAGLVNFLW